MSAETDAGSVMVAAVANVLLGSIASGQGIGVVKFVEAEYAEVAEPHTDNTWNS